MKNKDTNHSSMDMEHNHKKMEENKNTHDHENKDHSDYTCSMHPEVIQDHPGKCPKCGMFLEPIGGTGGDD